MCTPDPYQWLTSNNHPLDFFGVSHYKQPQDIYSQIKCLVVAQAQLITTTDAAAADDDDWRQPM